MKQDREIRIQALLDGELSKSEAAEVQELLARDSQAQALFNELTQTRSLLRQNEPEAIVPDARDFYWSQIQRRIESAEKVAAAGTSKPGFWLAWRRVFAPFAAVAAVAMLAVFSMQHFDMSLDSANSHLAEVENLSEHSSSLSFRSQSENMFVVWVYNKDQQTEEAEPDFSDDTVIQ